MTYLAIRRMAHLVDLKDAGTQRHSERVAEKVCRLALAAGWSETDAHRIYLAGHVHDVGKIGIGEAILCKPAALTAAEYRVIQLHPALSVEMMLSLDSFDEEQREWVLHHHERPDGRGYPDRLIADQITEGAALMALADSWDVMVSDRPYKRAMQIEDALVECHRVCGTQFTFGAVRALDQLLRLS